MYNTSLAYKQAIARKLIQSRMVLTITNANNESIVITDSRIMPNTVSYTNKASKNNNFGYGSAYVGEFRATILNVDEAIDRYSLYGAKVVPMFYQTLANNSEEQIPFGEFYVSEAKRTKKSISLTCYDAMTRFDVPQVVDTFGTPFELLELLCNTCGVTLGMTQEQVEAMTNGTEQLTMSAERVSSCRDAISYISTVLCGFATIDRTGALVIRQFGTSAVDMIPSSRRTSSTIADYQTYFLGIKARVLQAGNWIKVTANVSGRESGLILDLGDLPVVQGVNETLQRIAQNIANVLGTVNFTPTDVSITGDASIDIGDMVTFTGVNNTSDSVTTIVTSLQWKYHGVTRLVGEGGNARLNAVTDYQTKQVATLETDMSVNEYAMKQYTNSEQYNISSTDKTIITLNYSVNKDTVSAFICTIPIYMSKDGNAVFGYHLNTNPAEELSVYLERGWHAVTLTNYFANDSQSQNRLTVTCRTEYFESDKRQIDAKIAGLIDAVETGEYVEGEIDTTIPSAMIPTMSIKAILFASGINTSESWDGTLLLIEEIGAIALGSSGITVKPITDTTIVATSNNANNKAYVEQISAITLGNSTITVKQIVDAVAIGRKVLFLTIDTSKATEYTYSQKYVGIVNNAFTMNEEYPSPSQYVAIDDGALKKCDCDVNGLTPSAMTIVANGEGGSGGSSIVVLPAEYQEVEYIESGGTGYIDTGVNGTNVYGFKLKFKPVSYTGSSWNSILSGYLDNATLGYYENPTGFYFRHRGIEITANTNNMSIDWHTFTLDTIAKKFTMDAVEYSVSSANSPWATTSGNIIIFNSSNYSRASVGQFGRLTLYGQNGAIIKDLVPCYRISDNAIGVYDLASGSFLSAVGTFNKGANVTHNLPSTYQEVEYITSSGNQWIDTEVSLRNYDKNLEVEIDATIPATSGVQGMCYTLAGGKYWFSIPELDGANTMYVQCAAGAWATVSGAHSNRQTYKLNSKTGAYTVGQTSGTVRSDSFISAASSSATKGNIYLFAANDWSRNDDAARGFAETLYSCTIKDATTGIIIRKFIPCYRKSDNEVGLYDLVSMTFFENKGSGTFSKGADVLGATYKTLITDGTDVYSISNGALTASVGLLANLDAQMFEDYGFDDLQECVVAKSDVFALGEFSILRWCDDETETASTMLVTIFAVPSAQEIVTPVFSITGSNVTGIELTTTDTEGNPQVAVKFDSGDWEYYDFTDEMWEEVGTGTIGYMTIADLESLTEEIWAEKFETASTMQTKLTLTGVNDTITLVQYKFLQEEE